MNRKTELLLAQYLREHFLLTMHGYGIRALDKWEQAVELYKASQKSHFGISGGHKKGAEPSTEPTQEDVV